MPTPDALATLLANAASFNPTQARTEFNQWEPLWRLYLDLTELDGDKLKDLIEKHHDAEPAAKFELRQTLATVINLIPTVLDCVRQYLFAEEPVFDAKGDPVLEAFIDDCDGNGTRFADHVRQSVLPMAMAMGWVDSLVQNPMSDGQIKTRADASDVAPRIVQVLPLQRLNWSAEANDAYRWLTFKESTAEIASPLEINTEPGDAYFTLCAAGVLAGEGIEADRGVWIRSSQPTKGGALEHVADYCPTARVPMATLYYRKSNDPERRHYGLPKIALMAVLTKKIVNVLSWTDEDILANLAITVMPSKGGRVPKKEDGTETIQELTAFTIIYIDSEAKAQPMVLQGSVDHIKVKLALVELLVKEILRLAHLSTATGEGAAEETSGFHAVVNRNELFQELSDLAGALDHYCLDVFALVKSWASGQDVSRADVQYLAKFHKGPWTVEPLAQLIKDANAAIATFREISPTLCTNQYRQLARAILYQDDPDLEKVDGEIKAKAPAVLAADSAEALAQSVALAEGNVTENISEDFGNGEVATQRS